MIGILTLVAVGAAGCIRPIETVAPPTPTVPAAAPPPTATVAVEPAPAGGEEAVPPVDTAPEAQEPAPAQASAEAFVTGRGQIPADLQVWGDAPLGPDRLIGFSFTGADGLPCTGFLLISAAANNGAIACALDPAVPSLASVSYISTSDGQPYTIAFGRAGDPAITAIAVVFDDGSSQSVAPNLGGFMVLHPDIFSVVSITAVNAEGNTVIDNIPQVPAS